MSGRPKRTLDPGVGLVDALFASDRVDGQTFNQLEYRHCTFANVSFKDCIIQGTTFQNCVFAGCYFRRAQITNAKFIGCRFIDCDFPKIDVRNSEFKYNSFIRCYISYGELKDSLPPQGNLKSEMCVNLASEARAKGDIRDSERFRQAAADGLEEYLWAIITGRSEFHRQKYGTADRWAALAKLTASKVRRHLWGYRRSWIVVLRNWLALVLVGFPLWFYGVREGIKRNNRPAEVADIWLASLANALPGSRISDVTFVSAAAQFAALSEVLVSVLFGGLTAALLFRSIFERA
jgi:hypothetical protein